ncbi:unnamed protein product [Parnassius mnemosyne]|uniref:Uncharacterized protein n=1 Tax=Parnassius mnemosyne TaxID=213953 RepID=A0AAV1MAM6_9NEOP
MVCRCYKLLTVDFIYYDLGCSDHLSIATLNLSPLNLKHILAETTSFHLLRSLLVSLRPLSLFSSYMLYGLGCF